MTALVPILLAVLLAGSSAGTADYEQANELFRTGRYAEAGEALDRALAKDPALVPALTLRGKLALGLGRFDVAREALQRAVRLEPGSAYVQFLLGFFHYVDNDFRQAVKPLEQALKLDPANGARASFYLALTYEGLAQPDEAMRYYLQTLAVEKDRPSSETHTAYGRFLFSLGRYEESRAQIERALLLNPRSRDAHYERGRLLFEAGDFPGAAAEGEQALAIPGPGTLDRQIHFLLARAYRKTGELAKADTHLAAFKASPVSLRR